MTRREMLQATASALAGCAVVLPRMKRRAEIEPYAGDILDVLTIAGLPPETAPEWHTFWRGVYGKRMTAKDKAVFARHTGGRALITKPVSEAWMLIGRRGGKSRNAAIGALYLAISRDYHPILAPGEQALIPVIASHRDQAAQVVSFIKGLVAMPEFAPYVERELASSVAFKTGVTIDVASASYRSVRGFTVVGFVADEVAFWRSDESAEPDREIFKALRPAMATVPNSLKIVLSTPYARKGELYRVASENFGKDNPRLLVWNADTLAMHHDEGLAAEVAIEFDEDPVSAASEFGQNGHVVFRSDVESFVDPMAVEAVTVAGRRELPYVPGIRYVAFHDPSGGSQDASTLAIAHPENGKSVLDVVRETQPPFSPAAVTADYASLVKRYRITQIQGDHYGGEFPRELFRQHGITYRVSDYTKSDLYREVLPAINTGAVELLEHKRLRVELCQLERHVARSGQDTIDHAPGGHDDTANAVSGALVLASQKTGATISHVAL